MPNQTVNKVEFGNQTIMDITDTSANANDVIEGEVFYNAAGRRTVGTLGDATPSTHGLMSAADKEKLDNLSAAETDPTVPAWAKASTKPTYTAAEVGATTSSEVSSMIAAAIGNINEFNIALVNELPTTNIKTHTIYFVPKTGTSNDTYDEYMYINDTWELIGNTQIDLSNYALKSEIPTKVSDLTNDAGYLTTHQDISGKANKSEIPTKVSQLTNDSGFTTNTGTITGIKMNGASKGSSGVVDLGTVLTAHQDISGKADKSEIPTKVSELTNDSGFTSNTGTITGIKMNGVSKGSSGVVDLGTVITAHQDISGKADKSAIPTKVSELTNDSGFTTNAGTITGIKMNGASKGTSGVVDLGTVLTAHQDISGKADKSATVSNVAYDSTNKKLTKTINGTTSDVVTVATLKSAMSLAKGDVGLGNVDNKSSATIRDEITSSNVTTALGFTPMNAALKGANSGVAELDANGKVPSSQLPSYVDDVLEYDKSSSFPTTGETGKIYIAQDTNKTYRWSGTAYVEISASLALGETSSTAYRGDRGKTAYDHASAKGSAFSEGLYKITTNAQGHVTAATAVAKADITALGIPGSDTNTHRPIQVNGTEILGNNTTALNLKAGSNVSVTNSSGTVTIAATNTNTTYTLSQDATDGHKITLTPSSGTAMTITIPDNNTTYSSKTAASGGSDVSLVTTGEKYTWNNKSNLAIGTSATTAAAGNHTHGISIATSTGTNQVTLAANTKYALTAGGQSYIFTTPPDNNTDTKVTSVGNHYAPATDTSAALSANASGATAAWSIDVVTGVSISRDAKGHVTGVSVVSGKIPGNPNTDTKNTAGSTNSTSKLFLIGATSQAANPTTNSYQYTYTNNGLLSALKLGLNLNGTEKAHLEWNDTDQSIDFVFA